MKIVYATLENGHSTSKVQDANIPQYAAVFVRVGSRFFALDETPDGHLLVTVQNQIVVKPGLNNSIKIREESF